jgi:transposase
MIWIGVDAHKRVHEAVALGPDGTVGHTTVPNTVGGWASLLAWAAWPERVWAIEGSGALGRGLAQFLAGRGERVHEVSPKWTAQRRRTMRKPGKSDWLDAHAVARVLREEAETLPAVLPEEPEAASVELWSHLREDVVADMTRLRNRLHALLLLCDPEYGRHLPRLTTQAGLRACQDYAAPGAGALARAREQAVRLLAAQLALLARQERELRTSIERAVAEHFAPLTAIEGVGPLVAAGLIAELGTPRSGFGVPQLAALAGVAPLEASSAGGVRHRLNRLGNRRLNSLLYHIALVQARCYSPARAYLARRQQEGRTPKEARRALKRQLVRRVWRHWQACWQSTSTAPSLTAPLLAA